ncbi:hypothetical protein [Roseobacter sp. HKCCA0434]|uniref:hypothetical protein n=1 Tax=Roseobacter sp. HKCCA0434 TaxID=3079297 RepID=UPI002905F17A|nr:hypothetical protein [Roseobacter sp. HKCCA0434]
MADTLRIYDRAIILQDAEQIAALSADPRGFLESVGALEGLDQFNGLFDLDDAPISDVSAYLAEDDGVQKLTLVHRGIPYADYCGWTVIKVAP